MQREISTLCEKEKLDGIMLVEPHYMEIAGQPLQTGAGLFGMINIFGSDVTSVNAIMRTSMHNRQGAIVAQCYEPYGQITTKVEHRDSFNDYTAAERAALRDAMHGLMDMSLKVQVAKMGL